MPEGKEQKAQNEQNERKERFLGLDFGDKTIGIALGCPDSRVATGLTTLHRDQEAALRPAINQIKEIIAEYGITHIILGNPVHMDGSASPRTEKTLAFKEKLQRNFKSIKISLWDERLSTQAVTRAFYADSHSRGNTKGSKKRNQNKSQNKNQRETYRANVDEMAAVYILQGFLSKHLSKFMEETMANEQNLPEDENMENMGEVILVTDDDGAEYQLHVLASKETGGSMYLLAAVAIEEDDEDDTSEVLHFRCVPIEGDEDDMSLEMIDETHEDFEKVIALFKDDYEELGITIDEGDSILGV